MARSRRDQTEVSCVIKFLLFGFNVIFWLVGGAVLGVGVWSWAEKGVFSKFGQVTNFLDPALILIVAGAAMFVIGFFGCIGALRENTFLLLMYIIFLGLILVLILGAAVYAFIEQEKTKDFFKKTLYNMVVKYREDDDLKDVIDWAQEDWLQCCGVESSNDWDMNIYFNCSSPSVEKCGVPSSCCREIEGEEDMLKNTMCGFGVRDPEQYTDPSIVIYGDGCFEALTRWFNTNLIPIAGAAVGVALLMILGICFAQNLRSDIHAQKAKWEQ